jgi:hypothetical protein
MEGVDYNMQLEKWVLEGGNCGFHRMAKRSTTKLFSTIFRTTN